MIQHKHLLVNAQISRPIWKESDAIYFLEHLVQDIEMKIIKGPFAEYVSAEGNRGMTAVVMIETSHIAFHIWDEKDPAELKFDLYTCGMLNVSLALKRIWDQFGVIDWTWKVYDRAEGFELVAASN